jgi:hypothetical protein
MASNAERTMIEDVTAGEIGLILFVVAVLGATIQSTFSKPPKTGRRSPRQASAGRSADRAAADTVAEGSTDAGRSKPRPRLVGALLAVVLATAGGSDIAAADSEDQAPNGTIRIVIDSVATTAEVPNHAVAQVVAAATAGESYLAAHHLAQLAQALLDRAGYPAATGRRVDVELVLRARQAVVGVGAQGATLLGRWVQLVAVQPRSQAELWSGTAMSVGSCTLGEVGEVLLDELIGRIDAAGTAEVRATVPVASRDRHGCRD